MDKLGRVGKNADLKYNTGEFNEANNNINANFNINILGGANKNANMEHNTSGANNTLDVDGVNNA